MYIAHEGWANYSQADIQVEFFSFGTCIQSSVDLAICRCIDNSFTAKRLAAGSVKEVSFNTKELPDGTPVAFTGFGSLMLYPPSPQEQSAASCPFLKISSGCTTS